MNIPLQVRIHCLHHPPNQPINARITQRHQHLRIILTVQRNTSKASRRSCLRGQETRPASTKKWKLFAQKEPDTSKMLKNWLSLKSSSRYAKIQTHDPFLTSLIFIHNLCLRSIKCLTFKYTFRKMRRSGQKELL